SSPGIGPPTAALSAGRAPGAADKSKPPPRRRENQGIRAASLDHLNDPLSRGVLRRFRRHVLVSDGSPGPSRLTSSARFIRPFMLAASPITDSGYPLDLAAGLHGLGTHAKRVIRPYHSTFGGSQGIWACSATGIVERFRGSVLGKDLNRSESV